MRQYSVTAQAGDVPVPVFRGGSGSRCNTLARVIIFVVAVVVVFDAMGALPSPSAVSGPSRFGLGMHFTGSWSTSPSPSPSLYYARAHINTNSTGDSSGSALFAHLQMWPVPTAGRDHTHDRRTVVPLYVTDLENLTRMRGTRTFSINTALTVGGPTGPPAGVQGVTEGTIRIDRLLRILC